MTKYFLYTRKSTEDEERQVMSIEAQLAELAEFAKRENIEIAERFIESKSAKKPGREVFNEMMSKVQESKTPVGLLAWHPDRLARNSVDGGLIIYSIDTAKIASLRFPTFWFEPTPQGLFMLQVAFGQSKYYSDNLSENVKRGFRQKLRRGEWPGLAPFGYVNNSKTRTIEPEPTKARVIKKAFEEYAQGRHTLLSLGERLSFWGVVSGTGKPLCKATLQRMLTNKVYLGLIIHNGETYEGGFPAIVSRATFEKVQEVLKNRAKPRHSKKRHNFPFTGLLTCGECGAAITAQYAHGHGGTYKYYRCTKRLGSCSQSYLREDLLTEQLKTEISKVALCEDWKEKMLAQVEVWEKGNIQSSQSFAQNLEKEIKETETKLDRLVNAFLDGSIEKETYLAKKDELITTKTDLQQRKSDFWRKGNNWIEPLREWILAAHHAEKLASSNEFDEIKSFVEKIGTNRRLLAKKVGWDWSGEWRIVAENLNKIPPARERSERVPSSENSLRLTWSSGPHYNLNLIGVPKDKSAEMTGNNGHRIFVKLWGNCKINLTPGSFQVLDANCTDGSSLFQLPDPDPDNDGVTAYSVYARALGKPGGSAVATSCLTDAAGETWCSTENVVLIRTKGKSTFQNVSRELLSLCLDTDGDTICDTRTFLFDDEMADYFWDYDNSGLKLAQLRFYEIPTDVGLTP